MRRLAWFVCASLAGLVCVVVAEGGTQNASVPASSPLPLVPMNVRVLDKAGKPVTDLKQSDFTITENGMAVPIKYFSEETLAPDPSAADAPLSVRNAITTSPQNRRIFILFLGLGRLEEGTNAITALAQFVRTKLLPQDMVAIFAYDRALTFTKDHEKAAQVLDRCKKANGDMDMNLQAQLGPTGMAPLYGSKALPKGVQSKIDELFEGRGAKTPTVASPDIYDKTMLQALSLDDFMFSTGTTLMDQANLTTMLEYLRHFEGEKHLVYVTEKGMEWPSDENDRVIAQVANDGRVVIHALQAGGMMSSANSDSTTTSMNSGLQLQNAFNSLRAISEMTGGILSLTQKIPATVERLDTVTRTSYLIGYQPLNASWDGAYRQIGVKVNRPDVTVLYRHGYFRHADLGGLNRRGLITNDRLIAAGNFRREVPDLKVKVAVTQKGDGNLTVDAKINLSKTPLEVVDGSQVTTLDVAIFCMDSSGRTVATEVQQVPIKLTAEEVGKYQKEPYPATLKFPLPRGAQLIRFVVYDYRADLIGRSDTRVF